MNVFVTFLCKLCTCYFSLEMCHLTSICTMWKNVKAVCFLDKQREVCDVPLFTCSKFKMIPWSFIGRYCILYFILMIENTALHFCTYFCTFWTRLNFQKICTLRRMWIFKWIDIIVFSVLYSTKQWISSC